MTENAGATDPVSAGPALLCAAVAFVLVTAAAFAVQVEWFAATALGIVGAVSLLVGRVVSRRVRIYAIGFGAACGGGLPFAVWLTSLSGDQGNAFVAAWTVSVVGFVMVAALLGTFAAWSGRMLARGRVNA